VKNIQPNTTAGFCISFPMISSFSLHILPLFQYSIIPSFIVEKFLAIGRPFAFVEVIQSISTIGFRPCNGARLTFHIRRL
jgi:hypothetical protein